MCAPGKSGRSATVADAVAVVVLLAVAAVVGLRFSEIGLLGWDAYPILAASRSGSAGGLLAVLGQPLAGGLLPMSFYRPLLSLSVALEWPLWGLSAGGYVAVNAALLSLCGLALYRLLLRFGGTRSAAVTAVLFFILHPVVPEVVPYLPRRPELLCILCVVLALQLDHRGRFASSPASSRTSILGALLATAAAVGAKETAIALPFLIAAARWLFPAPGRTPWRQAARGFAAHGAVLAAMLLLHLRALDGLGGYPDTDVTQLPGLWLRTLAKTLLGVFLPEHPMKAPAAFGLAALALGIVLLAYRRTACRHESEPKVRVHGALAGFAAIWIVTLATVYAAAARLSPWYLLIVACGAAIGFGLAFDLALSAVRNGTPGRPAAVAAVLGGSLLLASFAADSPLFRPLEEFRQASRDSAAFLGALEQRIRRTAAGDRIAAGRYPRLIIGPGGRQVPVLVPHSLPGWARIVFPERRIIFVARGDAVDQSFPPDVTVVKLGRGIHKRAVAE